MRQQLTALAGLALILLTACTQPDAPTAPIEPSVSLAPGTSEAQLARTAQELGFVPGRVLVRFREGAPIADLVRAEGSTVQRQLALGTRLLRVPLGNERAVAAALSGHPLVDFAEPDFFYTVDVPCGTGSCLEPTDASFGYKWDLHNDGSITDEQGSDLVLTGAIDADLDWLEAFDAMGPLPGSAVIGIIDTGIWGTHEDLMGKVVAGYDFFDLDPDPTDDHGHGTHVAGIAAANGDNGTGVPGVAWVPEVQVAAAKVCGFLFGFLHGCPSSAIADGILWATDNGADVLNISLGGAEGSAAVQSALQYARQNGVLPFCAAGNDAGPVGFPAAFPECVAVSSTNWSDDLASYSNFGPEVELAAPGGDFEDPNGYSFILSSYYSSDTSYAWLAGTSMASPQAAGLGGLLHALGVADADEKLARMRATANDLGDPGEDVSFGAGRINAFAAVADLIGVPTNQVPNASFTANCTDLTCDFIDTSTDSEGPVVAWAWDFGDGNTSTVQHPTHTFAVTGTYTVTLTATDQQGASGSFSLEMSVPVPNQSPTASFTSSCFGFSCDFTDTSTDADGVVASWSWDFGDGAASTLQSPSHTYATAGTYTVTLTVTDDDGDTDTVSQTVTAAAPNDPPTASFTSSCSALVCAFTNTSTDGDGSVTINQWNFGDGWTSNGVSPSHQYGAPGTYTVTLEVYDDDSAGDTISAAVTVWEAGEEPTASFTTSCTDLTCTFMDTSTDSQGSVVAWSWDFGDGNTSTVQNPTHTYAVAGSYTVELTATDDVGASGTFSRAITVPSGNQAPTASFTSSCPDLTCVFTDASADGDGTVVAWSWDFGDGNTSTVQHPSHTYTTGGTYTVTLTATDDAGASDTVSDVLSVVQPNAPPTASFTWNCTDLTCAFSNTSADTDGTITTNQWTFGDGWTSNGVNPSHTYGAFGTYTVSLTIWDDDGASDTFSADVTVVAPGEGPTASFTSSCVDLACNFTDTSTEGVGLIESWSWDFGDGNTSNVQNPSHSFGAAGTYSVTLTVTDDRGASDTLGKDVTVPAPNQAPTASFTSSCTDLSCSFTDASADGDGTIVSWAWAFGDSNTSNVQNPNHAYSVAGTYSVTLTVTDDDGATDATTTTVAVIAPNEAPTASFTSNCSGLTCNFIDTSTDADGTIEAHQWSFGDGWSSNGANPSHLYQDAGIFTVTLTVTDDDGVTGSVSVDIPVGEAPVASFTSTCTGLTCDFTDTSTDGDGTIVFWSWDFGDGGSSFAQNPSHAYAAAGTYTVTLTVNDNDGVADTFTASVTVVASNQAPTASFTSSCTDLACAFSDTSSDSDGSVVAWAWAFGDGNTSAAQHPSHTYSVAGTYTVTLTASDDDGAADTFTASVTVTEPDPGPSISLGAVGYKVRGRQKADLSWSGAASTTVDIYRDGVLLLTTPNDGSETDDINARGSGSYTYQVCEAGTTTCSEVATVTF